jgi:hypothetical protein
MTRRFRSRGPVARPWQATHPDADLSGRQPHATLRRVSQALLVGRDKGLQSVMVSPPDIKQGAAQEKPSKHPVLAQQQCEYHLHIQSSPPGKYTLNPWHGTLGEQAKEVTVNLNAEVKVGFGVKGS